MIRWRSAGFLVFCAITLLAAGCADPSRVRSNQVPPDPPPLPAPKPDFSGRQFAAPPNLVAPAGAVVQNVAIARPSTYRVQPGDTVFGISRRLDVPLRALIDRNGLAPPYTLAIGQTLQVPGQRVHVVKPGNTVYGISRAYGVDMSELMRANGIAPPYRIAVGQRLLLPEPSAAIGVEPVQPVVMEAAVPAPAPAPSSAAVPAPAPERHAPAITPPRDPNLPYPPLRPEAGNPPPGPARAPALAPGLPARSEPRVATGTSVAAAPATQPSAAIPKPPELAAGKFLWPVQGEVASRFGPQGDGRHNDGVNIRAPRGTPVLAAQNGVVAYVGNELRGFGNLLLIKHADGWVTAYAHLDRITVARGAKVRRGDAIGLVGSSGSVSDPQLHFEIRKGSRAVDPMRQLSAGEVDNAS